MLRIRLRRVGKKKQPMYRIVVADSRAPRDGRFVDILGYYHPLEQPSKIVIDAERTRGWLDKGALPSDRVAKLLAIKEIADIPAKLKTRIELGQKRAEEAKKEQPKAEAEAEPAAEAEAVEAEAEGESETPAAEAASEEAEAPQSEAAPDEDAGSESAEQKPAAESEDSSKEEKG